MITKSFLTGSRAYGVPKPDSDTDIVIRCDKQDVELFGINIEEYEEKSGYPIDNKVLQLKINSVNYILCFDDIRFNSWLTGTDKLKLIAPVSRDIAKAVFIDLFNAEKRNDPI